MALDLNDHLLQTVDGLVTTLLWKFVLNVTLGLTGSLTSSVFGLFRDILRGLVLQVLHSRLGARLSVHTRVGPIPLVTCRQVSSLVRVPRATWVRGLSRVSRSVPHIGARERLLLVNLTPHLILDVVPRRNVMPGVVIGRAVNLCELILGWVHTVSCALGGIAGHVTKENSGIAHCTKSARDGMRQEHVQLTEFPELAIGEDESPEGSQTIQCLVTVLFRGILINGGAGQLSIGPGHLLRLPDEVLQEIAGVLGEKQDLGLLDHGTEVGS